MKLDRDNDSVKPFFHDSLEEGDSRPRPLHGSRFYTMRSIFKAAVALLLAVTQPSEGHSVKRNPLNYVTRLDHPIIHTPSHRVNAYSSFELTFLLHEEKQKIRISLEPNHDIIPESLSITHLGADGAVVRHEKVERTSHKVFKGDAFVQYPGRSDWINSGFARLTISRDGPKPVFQGVFRIHGNHHHIVTASSYRKTRLPGDPDIEVSDDEYMVVWRDTDVLQDPVYSQDELKRGLGYGGSSCSSDDLQFNTGDDHPVHLGLDLRNTSAVDTNALSPRQIDGTTGGNGAGVNLASTIGSTVGCPTTRRVALVGIATDCTYRAQFDSESDMRENIINLVNTASQLYESTFNISLGIQNLTTQEPNCPGTPPESVKWNVPCSDSVTLSDRLSLFSQWRGQFTDTNAYWTLLSTCNTDSAVGLAWLGQVCTTGSRVQAGDSSSNETIAGANVVVRTDSGTEWQIFAHESGHTFGAFHDCTATTCSDGTVGLQKCCPLSTSSCDADGDFIMNPSTGRGITQFSACSIGNICSAMGRNSVSSSCLSDNRGVPTITGSQCGNGIVEEAEECDCGGETGCGDNSCCDAATCRFKDSAVCDPANEDCCTTQCQFASKGTVCRTSTGTCDPEESCAGDSAMCPKDVKTPDGLTCGDDGAGLTCASGQCTSRDQQCKTLVGSLTSSQDTTACDMQSGSCIVTCSSPKIGPEACYNMQQYFLDGTPCDGGGACQNGVCEGSSWARRAIDVIKAHLNVVIPVVCVVGGLILVSVFSCCISSCRRRRRVRKARVAQKAIPPNSSWVAGSSMGNAAPGGSGAWAANAANAPYPPPPAYPMAGARSMTGGGPPNNGPWMPRRSSTRYA